MRRSTVLSLPLQLALGSQKRQWLYLSWLPWGTSRIVFICLMSLRVGTTLCLVLIPETVFWVVFWVVLLSVSWTVLYTVLQVFCGSFAGIFAMGVLVPYSQHFIFFVPYEWPQVLLHTRLERVGRDKHTSSLDLFVSNE